MSLAVVVHSLVDVHSVVVQSVVDVHSAVNSLYYVLHLCALHDFYIQLLCLQVSIKLFSPVHSLEAFKVTVAYGVEEAACGLDHLCRG